MAKWTIDDNKCVREMYENKEPVIKIAEELNRTMNSVRKQISRLGLTKKRPKKSLLKKREKSVPWIESDKKILTTMWKNKKSAIEIANILGRSAGAVRSQAHCLGLTWSYEDRFCKWCGKSFSVIQNNKVTCSPSCSTQLGLSKSPILKLSTKFRIRLLEILEMKTGRQRTDYIFGWNYTECIEHFQKDPLWEEWCIYRGEKYHIDHIIPLSLYKIESKDDPEIRKAWHYRNLRITTVVENLKKKDKLDMKLVKAYAIEDLLPTSLIL